MDILSTFLFVPYFAVVSAAVAATIGERKGRAFSGALLGLVLGPLGVAITWGMTGDRQLCAHCRERIHCDASACPHCTRPTDNDTIEPAVSVDNSGKRVLFVAVILAVFAAATFAVTRSLKEPNSTQPADRAEVLPDAARAETGIRLNGKVCTVTVTSGRWPLGLALYDKPTAHAMVAGRLADGTRVCAQERRGNWQLVVELPDHNNGAAGWCDRQYLVPSDEACFTE